MQVDREGEKENLKHQEILALGKWPWDMQKMYEDKVWQLHEKKEIGFTYRSQFERDIAELPKELQSIILSKLWNDGRDGISAYVLGATRHQGYHYKQEGLLYDLYVKNIILPLYGGSNGRVSHHDSQ